MLLGLEDVEQDEAGDEAKIDTANPAERASGSAKRRLNRGRCRRICRASRWWSISMTTPARAAATRCIGSARTRRTARHRAGTVPGAGGAPAQICLPGLRERGGAGARAGTADRGRIADRSHGGAGPRLQIRRSPSAIPPGSDLRPTGHRARSLDLGRLGRQSRLHAAAGARAPADDAEGLGQAVRRRDHGAGARSGSWADQDWPAVGLRAG